MTGWGREGITPGPVAGATAGGTGTTGAGITGGGVPAVGAEPTGGSDPVAGAGSGGISSLTEAAPCAGPMDAVRRLTACNTRSVSSLAPTAKALAGLPSTAINAKPCPDASVSGSDLGRALGAITPSRRKRELASGLIVAAAVATGAAPSRRVRSPRTAIAVATGTACAGASGERTIKRRPQNTAVPATRAQITNAHTRTNMH